MKFFIIVGEFSEQVGEFFEKVGEFKKIYFKVGELSGDELSGPHFWILYFLNKIEKLITQKNY